MSGYETGDMPEDMPGDMPDDRDLQAAEYVLGALPPQQARAMEALALSDPAVAASIAAWEGRLAPLADLVPPIQPPTILWRRLALAAGIDNVVPAPLAATRTQPRAQTRAQPRAGLWRSTGFWRATTGLMLAAAASFAFLLYRPATPGPEPLLAALTPAGTPGATFLIRVGADGVATITALGTASVPQGRSLELWAVTTGSTTPIPVGLLPANGRARLAIPQPQGTKLLVSQEPLGGSPTKLPTGPVVYAGQLEGI